MSSDRTRDSEHYVAPPRKPILAPLVSIRFLAALHIFLFHVLLIHRSAGSNYRFSALDELPAWMIRLFERGYCSTSLFFTLSGFILAYLYVDTSGRQAVSNQKFWRDRLVRIYPLHLIVLILIAPLAIPRAVHWTNPTIFGFPVSPETRAVAGFAASATLVQSWIPDISQSWNTPTWALSVVVFFYLVFPLLVKGIDRLSPAGRRLLLAVLPGLGVLPSVIYLVAADNPQKMSLGDGIIKWWPLFWLPHFAMGMILARHFNLSRFATSPDTASPAPRPSWGDLAAAALIATFVLDDSTVARISGIQWVADRLGVAHVSPYRALRHGLLAPFYLLLILDLARNRGLVARVLGHPWFAAFGETSFSIFILQFPLLALSPTILPADRIAPVPRLLVLIVLIVGMSYLSVKFVERPLANLLKKRAA